MEPLNLEERRARGGPLFTDTIPHLASIIFEKVDQSIVEKIYLFGSYAYGEPDEDSDLDICIVLKDDVERVNVMGKPGIALLNYNIYPCDTLIYRSKYFYNAPNPEGVESIIKEKGRLLYEQTGR